MSLSCGLSVVAVARAVGLTDCDLVLLEGFASITSVAIDRGLRVIDPDAACLRGELLVLQTGGLDRWPRHFTDGSLADILTALSNG